MLPLAAREKMNQTFGVEIPGHSKDGTKVIELKQEELKEEVGEGGDFSELVGGVPSDDIGLPSNEQAVALKVDVEGHELEAQAGDRKFICSNDSRSHSHEIVSGAMEIRGASLFEKDKKKAPRYFIVFRITMGLYRSLSSGVPRST